MTRTGIAVLVAAMLLASQAPATNLGFHFDANTFIQSYGADFTTGLKASQLNARRVHSAWGGTYYNTFSDFLGPGTSQSQAGNTYANWAAGLGAGEGITAFNIWLLDNPNARSWGVRSQVQAAHSRTTQRPNHSPARARRLSYNAGSRPL